MKSQISASMYSLACGLVLAITPMLSLAETTQPSDSEPAIVIAVASINDQLDDVEYLAGATSEAIGQMSGLLRFQAQGFLTGVDFSKPLGVFLHFEEGQSEPKSVGFVPIKNFEDILDKISEFAQVEEEGESVTIIPDNGEELSLVKKGDYIFVSPDDSLLKNLPEDPAAMLAEQSKAYNVSAKVFPQRIPESLRQDAIEFIRDGFESAMDEMDELQAEIQEAQFEMQMKQIEMAINDFERLTVGICADKSTERIYVDINMKGLQSSEMAKKLNAAKNAGASQFAGFLMENAALTVHNCSGVAAEDVAISIETLNSLRDTMISEIEGDDDADENEVALAKKISNQLIEVIEKTLKGGTIDMGGVVFTDNGINAAFGGKVVDARKLESSIKEIVAEAESKIENDEVVFNLNSGNHNGITLHNIAISIDEEEIDEIVTDMFGEKIKVVLGIGEEQVYLAFGKDPETLLKKSIDANAKSASTKSDLIGQYNIFLTPIMKMVAEVAPEEEMVEELHAAIADAGKDRVRATYDVKDGEAMFRLEVQDGIFKMIGAATENLGGFGGGGGADF